MPTWSSKSSRYTSMVFFTCNACGSSLKKNQVEKHYRNECRSCSVLSCMDCGQDFYGDDYAGHTKCISEAEKYQGAMYKGSENKGDCKQEAWLEKAREAMQSAKVSSKIAALLSRICDYPNIPRKRKKFENFVRNSCNVRDQNTLDELWSVFNAESQSNEGSKEAVPSEDSKEVLTSKEEDTASGKQGGKSNGEKKVKKTKKKTRSEQVSCNGCEEVKDPLLSQSGTAQDGSAAACRLKEDETMSSTVETTIVGKKKKKKHCAENGLDAVVEKETATEPGEDASEEKMQRRKKRKKLEPDEKIANGKRQKLPEPEVETVEKHPKVKKKHKIKNKQ